MRPVVIYAGRFHPFHGGHRQVYEYFVKKYGPENVFIATSGKQDNVDKPFSFDEKKKMMIASGVPEKQIYKVKSPYRPKEITSHLDPENTAIIFPLGDDDRKRLSFKPKKDGTPSYMQPLKGNEDHLQPFSKHGYVTTLPRFKFKVLGKPITSGTQFRNLYLNSNDKQRLAILTELYGNKAKYFKPIFDERLSSLVTESFLREFIEFIYKF